MKDIGLYREEDGRFRPDTQDDWELCEKMKFGDRFVSEITKPLNYENRKRLFALFRFAFKQWSPPETIDVDGVLVPVTKDFESFREEVTMYAGWIEIVINTKGEAVTRAKSISNRAIGDDTKFLEIYDRIKTAIWELIFSTMAGYTEEEFERSVSEFMRF